MDSADNHTFFAGIIKCCYLPGMKDGGKQVLLGGMLKMMFRAKKSLVRTRAIFISWEAYLKP